MKFSPNQELALKDNNGKNMLVSAGAGSGKTAVLTERVYRLINSGANIDKFLILTFTNLAADSMKNKIRKKLLEDEKFAYLSSEIDLAHIETFDAFCLFLVKKYSYKLNINKDVSIGDQSILEIKKRQYLDEIFEQLYIEKNPVFVNLISKNCVKSDSPIVEFVLSISKLANQQIDKYAFLINYIDNYYNDRVFDNFISQGYNDAINNLMQIRNGAQYLQDVDDAQKIIDFIDGLLINKNFDNLYNAIHDENAKFPLRDRKSLADDKDYRDSLKDIYNDLKKRDYGSIEVNKELFYKAKPAVSFLIEIVISLEKKMDEFMKKYNVYSFNAIASLTCLLLDDKEVLKEIKESFDYILIDEYQDTNDIQEFVISKLERNNLFMVGDIKQSIYRFRNANCQIFQDKYESYSDPNRGTKIDLNTSFRSRKEVVDIINEMFSKIMVKENNPIDYSTGHAFSFGASKYLDNVDSKEDYKLKIYNYPSVETSKTMDKEARIIADDIANKINNKYQVYDKDLDKLIDCSFKDFAIIVDRSTNFDDIKSVFVEYNIPLKIVGSESLTSSDVANVLKNLFKLIYKASNNEYDQVYEHAFFSIGRSFLFSMSDDELFEIHKNKTYLVSALGQKIELLNSNLKFASLSTVYKTLVKEFDIYNKIITIGRFSSNTHRLESLYSLISSMDSLGFTLSDLTSYFDYLLAFEMDVDFSDNDQVEDAVTLITIHKSKGLEYNFCYFPGLSKKFANDKATSFIASKDYGLLLPYNDDNAPTSLLNHLYREKDKKEELEEKIRLFYVALTRACERIILLNPVDLEKEAKPVYSLNSLSSFTKLIYYCDLQNKYGVNKEVKNIKLNLNNNLKPFVPASLKQISVKPTKVENARASKDTSEKVDYKKLEFGTRLHAYLEATDFINKDVSFIKDNQIKKYVINVINNPLFGDLKDCKILHEYHFYDDKQNINGIIDLLLIKKEEIIIIDFKLKNIDDEAYVEQLKVYMNFIKTISDKRIKLYLLSAITGKEEEVYA